MTIVFLPTVCFLAQMAATNAPTFEARFRIRRGKKLVFGPGKAELLEHIIRTGSITEAAKAMKMSYMRAWTLVQSMNRGWREPLVTTARGGSQRGGAQVSETGRALLACYREMESASASLTRTASAQLVALAQS